jgi:hypothetical protein
MQKGERSALAPDQNAASQSLCRPANIKESLGYPPQIRVTSLPRLGALLASRVIGERIHEFQQHLPQQRGRLLADGPNRSKRRRPAFLAHPCAVMAAARRACGTQRQRNAKASRRLIPLSFPLVRAYAADGSHLRSLGTAHFSYKPAVMWAADEQCQSTLAPDALTTSAHFGISDFT